MTNQLYIGFPLVENPLKSPFWEPVVMKLARRLMLGIGPFLRGEGGFTLIKLAILA